MKRDKCGIYEIVCKVSGKRYVGSSRNIYKRWSEHRRSLRLGTNPSPRLQRAWIKHGEENFSFSVIEECEAGILLDREEWYTGHFKPDYNSLLGARIRRISPEVLAKRTATLRVRAAAITHCPRGHEYTSQNTYRNGENKRICRACNALRGATLCSRETPEQRAKRLAKKKSYYEANRERLSARMREYALAHKAEKRAYDKAYRLR